MTGTTAVVTSSAEPRAEPAASDGGPRLVAQAWLASRGLILLVLLLLAVLQHRSPLDMVGNWDVLHFGSIAQHGYGYDPKEVAFFPGLPTLFAAGLALGVPYQVTGIAIALVGSAFAAAALYRLGGRWAAIAWLFAPTAVFTALPYTESLFCALAFWAWERARADRWAIAAVLTALACTVRVSGLFLVGALAVFALTSVPGWAARGRRLIWLVLPTAVLGGFVAYLHARTGSWTAWYQAQAAGWARTLTWPWQSFLNTVPAIVPGAYPDHPGWAAVFRAEVVAMVVGVLVTGWCLGRRRWAEASWVGVQVLAFSLSYWFFSVNRAILLWFPLWIMVAELGQWRPQRSWARLAHRTVVAAAFVLSVVLMLVWCWLFFTGHWAS